MLGGDIPDSVAQQVWLYLLENFISFILLFRSTFCLFLLFDTCTDSPGSYTFDRVFPTSSVLIFNKQYLIKLPHPEKEIVVVKGLEQELNSICNSGSDRHFCCFFLLLSLHPLGCLSLSGSSSTMVVWLQNMLDWGTVLDRKKIWYWWHRLYFSWFTSLGDYTNVCAGRTLWEPGLEME